MREHEPQIDLYRLAETLARLMKDYDYGWVPLKKLAKSLEGSEFYADLVEARVSLPDWQEYFRVSRSKKIKLTEEGFGFLQTPCTEQSLSLEIAKAIKDYASSITRIRVNIMDIVPIDRKGRRVVHDIRIAMIEDPIPSETPVEFRPIGSHIFYSGWLVGQEPDGERLYVAFEQRIYPDSLPAQLVLDRAFLLRQLATRFEQMSDLSQFSRDLFETPATSNRDFVEDIDSGKTAEQLARLTPPWTRFLWGPPGAGKSYAVAKFILSLLRQSDDIRILLVAPSNRAVDVAVEQLLQQLKDSSHRDLLTDRKILRYGYAKLPSILSQNELLGSRETDQLGSELSELSEKIKAAQESDAPEQEAAIHKAELLSIQEALKAAVERHVGKCKVVATTTTMAYLDSSPIRNFDWDVVIVDEVTMVPPAVCTFLGTLARTRFLLTGDPRQLGPVFSHNSILEKNTERWMGRDIFDFSQVAQKDGEDRRLNTKDARLARIRSQRRCAEPIWAKVKHLYPQVENLAPGSEGSQSRVVLVDLSEINLGRMCEREYKSWKNEFSGNVAFQLIKIINASDPGKKVAIITPYRAQYKMLRDWIKEGRRNVQFHALMEAGTVHQFQGSEADIVIFDLVEGRGRPHLGVLLRGETGQRLVNVAITRACEKLFVIADRQWLRRHSKRRDNPLLWDLITKDDIEIDRDLPRQVFKEML